MSPTDRPPRAPTALSALDVLGVAIKSEIQAAQAYQQMMTLAESRDVKRKLRFLRDEERKHRTMLEEMYAKEYPGVKLELPTKGLAPQLSTAITRDTPLVKLFELALDAELASERFYAEAAERSESQTGRRLLAYLSGMERGHYFVLKSEYDLMQEFDRFESYKRFSAEHVGP
jgi:rubrerythrin